MKRFGEMLLRFFEKVFGDRFYKGSRAAIEMELLYPGKNGQARLREYYAGKFLRMFYALLAGCILFAAVLIGRKQTEATRTIARSSYGERTKQVELQVETEDGTRHEVSFGVSPRTYSETEAAQRLLEAKSELESRILGENESLDRVCYDLMLVTEILPGPIRVSWQCSDYTVLDSSGSIRAKNLPDEGCSVYLQATLSYGDQSEAYGRMITVFPAPMSEEARFLKHLDLALEDADGAGVHEESLTLPDEVDGVHLNWHETEMPLEWAVLFLTPMAMIVLYRDEDQRLHERLKKRARQMEQDYSEILNKLVLLLGAGMTVRACFERITDDYRKYSEDTHFAYEEMILTVNEMKQGVPELTAYEHFGRRCGNPSYLKLSALLVQNLKKGSKGLLDVFRRESAEALEVRRHLARQKGEEAGTKLLIPMFLMLGVVLVMVMVPAFRSMQL